jgi:uncharacterized membrane protein YfcA
VKRRLTRKKEARSANRCDGRLVCASGEVKEARCDKIATSGSDSTTSNGLLASVRGEVRWRNEHRVTAELGLWALAFVGVVCLIAGFAHGALGFGFPIVATPLITLVIDIKSAIALLAPVTLVLVLISVVRGGALGRLLREFWFMPFAMALGAFLGTRLLLAAPPEPFLLVLAGVVLLYLNLDRLQRGRNDLVARLRAPFGVGFGLLAGASEAVANVAGPFLLIYFMLLGLVPSQLVQALNLCFTFGKSSQVLTLASAGALTPATWAAGALLTVPSVLALYVGMRLRERIDAATYRRWLRGALWVMSVMLLAQFANALIRSS